MNGSGRAHHKRQWMALALCLLLAAALVLSTAFVSMYAQHEHDTDGPDGACSVCVEVVATFNLIRQMGYACAILAILAAFQHTAMSLFRDASSHSDHPTLVTLHTRQNN
ncbi:hypothetical protein AGMMS49992_05820 [Clostridia bacterium]|nr:hypothetical protein AGMMS49992_05820 [Clostridia bacterium]